MSYGSYKYIQYKQLKSGNTVRIDLLKKDYTGSTSELKGVAESDSSQLFYEDKKIDEFSDNPIQKSRLEVYFLMQGDTDLALLQEIFSSDESQFMLQKKVTGTVV